MEQVFSILPTSIQFKRLLFDISPLDRGNMAKRTSSPSLPLEDQREQLLLRLKRAEGQVRAVIRLIEAGSGCETVAQQLAASRKALDRSFYALLGCALEHGEIDRGEIEALLTRYV
jgi:CsoR family transcriptional regulator, copper-sensing transcriptional repressor